MIIALVALLGAVIGSLCNLLVVRIPLEGRAQRWPHCTRCGARLASWQLVPLLGWLLQRGRARCCGRRLHWMFVLVELVSITMTVVLYLRYDGGLIGWYLVFVVAVLLVTGAIDWFHRLIYTLPMLGATLVALLVPPLLSGVTVRAALAGALAAGFVFLIFYILARVLFPALSAPFGLGDVYLGIFLGAALSLRHLGSAVFYGMLAAGVYSAAILLARRFGRKTPTYIAYGSFLCAGAILYIALFPIV